MHCRLQLQSSQIIAYPALEMASAIPAGTQNHPLRIKISMIVCFIGIPDTMHQPVIHARMCPYKAMKRTDARSGGDEQEIGGCKCSRMEFEKSKRTVHIQWITLLKFFQPSRNLTSLYLTNKDFEIIVLFATIDRVLAPFSCPDIPDRNKLASLKLQILSFQANYKCFRCDVAYRQD